MLKYEKRYKDKDAPWEPIERDMVLVHLSRMVEDPLDLMMYLDKNGALTTQWVYFRVVSMGKAPRDVEEVEVVEVSGRQIFRENLRAIMRGEGDDLDDWQAHDIIREITEWHDAGRPQVAKMTPEDRKAHWRFYGEDGGIVVEETVEHDPHTDDGTYTKNQVLAIFAAVGNRLSDDSNRLKKLASVSEEDGDRLRQKSHVLDIVQTGIFDVVNRLTDGTNPETI